MGSLIYVFLKAAGIYIPLHYPVDRTTRYTWPIYPYIQYLSLWAALYNSG